MMGPLKYILVAAWLAAWAYVILFFSIGVVGAAFLGLGTAGVMIGVSLLAAGALWTLGNKVFPDRWRGPPE